MHKLAVAALLLYSSTAAATVTLSWVPGEVVDGAAVSEWIILCGPDADPFSNPVRLPFSATEYKMENLPDGDYRCKARAYSSESDSESEDSEVIPFVVKDTVLYSGPTIPFAIPLVPKLEKPEDL